MLTIISPSLAEGKERKAGGAVVGCSSPGTVPTDAATLWFPSCHFTGVAGEAVPAARAATSLGHGGNGVFEQAGPIPKAAISQGSVPWFSSYGKMR